MDAMSEDSRSEINEFEVKILSDEKLRNDDKSNGNCYW